MCHSVENNKYMTQMNFNTAKLTSRTSDSKATRPGQIGMAATCGNGYVFDKLLKKRRRKLTCSGCYLHIRKYLAIKIHILYITKMVNYYKQTIIKSTYCYVMTIK